DAAPGSSALETSPASAESCAAIGLVFIARRMLEIQPDSRYADVMERALYNGVLSGMALDGKSFFYVNPLEVLPEACEKDSRKWHVKPVRQKWFGCACCPPNLARLLSSIASYAYTETEDTLFVHLYIGSEITKRMGDTDVCVSVESGLPWDGDVKIRVRAKGPTFRLALRIPDWAVNSNLYTTQSDAAAICSLLGITGIDDAALELRNGYLYIAKNWGEKDTFSLHFPIEPRLLAADPHVREDIGKAAVSRGPIVYCLEEADNGKDLHLLTLNPSAVPEIEDIEICGIPAKAVIWPGFRQESEAPANREAAFDADVSQPLYHTWTKPKKEAVRLKYVPYYMWANRSSQESSVSNTDSAEPSITNNGSTLSAKHSSNTGAEMQVWTRLE
ncbi:MAG: glycoside hydrolase family 127 protein, partial [Lachnospiraceae bacterium]|nr:glycoside hydrolase family 127 protein [Lachnospiraceae bacterium]